MRHALSSYSAIRAGMLALALLLLANPTQPAPTADPAATQPTPFKPEELEQIVAPIALYPDTLLAQVFMASTYPLEIVQAARWSKAHPEVKGDAVAKEMEKQVWDASVKSLVTFPDVLKMMDEKIDWTQKLGDAFLAQQKDVMAAVQRLRVKAKDTGNLKTTKEQVVKTEAAPAGAPAPQIVVIESSSPEVIYVPTYNPTVVYGAWPYPAYPPYYYYPPGYAAGAAFFSFSAGVIVGGAIWGNCNWGGGDVDIDINRYNNFNRNEINHSRNAKSFAAAPERAMPAARSIATWAAVAATAMQQARRLGMRPGVIIRRHRTAISAAHPATAPPARDRLMLSAVLATVPARVRRA